MSDGGAIVLRDLRQPESPERNGNLVSSGPGWAEIEMTDGGSPILGDAMVAFQTSETIYLGHVDTGQTQDQGLRLRIRVDHSLPLQDVSSIQQAWSQEQSD